MSCTYIDNIAVVSRKKGLVITHSSKITFSKSELSKTGAGDCWGRAENPLIQITSATVKLPMAIKLHVTAVLPQYVLHVCEQSQGNPRKVFWRPLGTGLQLFWEPVCSVDPFWPHLLWFNSTLSKNKFTISSMYLKRTCGFLWAFNWETGFLTLNEESS